MNLNAVIERHRKLFSYAKNKTSDAVFNNHVVISPTKTIGDYTVKPAIKPIGDISSSLVDHSKAITDIKGINYPELAKVTKDRYPASDNYSSFKKELALKRQLYSQSMEDDYYS